MVEVSGMLATGVKFVSVTDSATLLTALSAAASSTSLVTVDCAAGNYGDINVGYGRTFTSGVVIRSNNDAVFSSIIADDVKNLTLQNIVTGPGAVTIRGSCRNILCSGLTITGGITIRDDGQDVSVIACDISIGFGITVSGSKRVQLLGNVLHDYYPDGFQLGGVEDVIIRGNIIYDSPEYSVLHTDFIQFYTSATLRGSKNVKISSNIFLRGLPARNTQGIFMRDQYKYGEYDGFLIENNLISPMNNSHGISVGGADDEPVWNNTVIRNNTVVRGGSTGTQIWFRSYIGTSTGNLCENNVSNDYDIVDANVSQSGDIIVLPTQYNEFYINGYRGLFPEDWLPVPGGPVDFGSGVGCEELMKSIPKPTYWIATVYAGLQVTCTATPYRDPDLDETGFTYTWASSDSGSGSGKTWVRTFASAGTYTIEVTVNGETFEKTVIVS